MIALPIYLQMVLEYNALEAGLSLAPLSLSMFVVALVAGKEAGKRSPSRIIRAGFLLLAVGIAVLIPIVPRAHSGWAMVVPLLIAGAGSGCSSRSSTTTRSRRSRRSASARPPA